MINGLRVKKLKTKNSINRLVRLILWRPRVVKVVSQSGSTVISEMNHDIFQRYHTDPIFTDKSWGGFQTSPTYWLSNGFQAILLSDEKFGEEFNKQFSASYQSSDELGLDDLQSFVFFIRFTHDEVALVEISKIIFKGGRFVSSLDSSKTPYRFMNQTCYQAMKQTWSRSDEISHLFPVVHENLCEALEITKDLNGSVVEIGVYKGGSALTILNYLDSLALKSPTAEARSFFGLDTFSGFDYPTAKESSDLIWLNTHRLLGIHQSFNLVKKLLSSCSTKFQLYVLDICRDSLPNDIISVSVANIDVDMYEPTKMALEKISPLVQNGGIILCEDATSTPALYGASLALKEFLETEEGANYIRIHKTGQIFLLKS